MTDASIDPDWTGTDAEPDRATSRQFTGRVTALESIMGDSALLTIAAPPHVARETHAGRFVQISCRYGETFDPLLRRPYSVFAADAEAGRLQVLVRPYGRGSAWLARRSVRDPLNVLGPLGNAFQIAPQAQNLLMIAGGVGVAPLVMLANEAVAQRRNVVFLLGAMTADALLAPHWLPGDVEYVVATNDGSKGHRGFVTDLIPDYVRWADQVFACGPEPMYRSLRSVLGPLRLGGRPPVQVSMERTMACGLGACLGCMVETRRGLQTCCMQGPVFDMDDIVWRD